MCRRYFCELQGTASQYRSFNCSCNTQECGFCNNELHDPIQLPCHHIACFDCAKRLLESSDKKCSLCQAAIPNDFEITEDKKGLKIVEFCYFVVKLMYFRVFG